MEAPLDDLRELKMIHRPQPTVRKMVFRLDHLEVVLPPKLEGPEMGQRLVRRSLDRKRLDIVLKESSHPVAPGSREVVSPSMVHSDHCCMRDKRDVVPPRCNTLLRSCWD